MRYKIVAGHHVHDDGERYAAGDVIESDKDLIAMFPNKFISLDAAKDESEPKNKKTKKVEKPKPEEVEQEDEEQSSEDSALLKVESKLGENVTEDFPKAIEAGVCVFKDKNKVFHVTDPETPDECDGEFTDKKSANKHLASLVK